MMSRQMAFSAGAWVSGCWRTAISSLVCKLYSSPKYLLNHRPLHTQPTFQCVLTNDGWPRQFVMSWKHGFLPFQSSNLSASELISPREYFTGSIKRVQFFPLESLNLSPKCLLFQPIIWAGYAVSVQAIQHRQISFWCLLRYYFIYGKMVDAFDSEFKL